MSPRCGRVRSEEVVQADSAQDADRVSEHEAAMMEVRIETKRMWLRRVALLALLLSLPTCMFLADEYYYRIDYVDMTYWRVNNGLSDADLERIWTHKPATSKEIEEYLRDATLVGRSHFTPKTFRIIYADAKNDYVEWQEGQPAPIIGHWETRWSLEHRV